MGLSRTQEKILGEVYDYYQKVHGVDPALWQIRTWSNMHISRLQVEHSKLKGVYETKVRISKES